MSQSPMVCGPGHEFQLVADRVQNCAVRLNGFTDEIRAVQAIDWQSPAGEAFRQGMTQHLRNVGQLHDAAMDAVAALRQLAEMAAAEGLSRSAGG
ncbi:hypothetical protein [Arthrobacter castelli]|uniref:hypothetical protein n=1 Tax=Arthrobacter castelli TaxID=271431 RepID=UPI00056D2F27|nr:hypothetical protein [Arthrobacter castelli]